MEKDIKKQNQEQSGNINEKRDLLQKHSFQFMFQMIVIIGGPALLAAHYGKKIGIERDMHPKLMIIFMISALAFSWLIILIKFFKFNKEIKRVDEEIKREKEKI